MSCTWQLPLGIEHYSFESKGKLGPCSWMNFPEDAGGKTAADFRSNLSSKTSGLVRPFNFLGSPWEREGQGRGTCEKRAGQENPRIILIIQTLYRTDCLPCSFGPTVISVLFSWFYKIASAVICLLMMQIFKFYSSGSLTAVSWVQPRCPPLQEWEGVCGGGML